MTSDGSLEGMQTSVQTRDTKEFLQSS